MPSGAAHQIDPGGDDVDEPRSFYAKRSKSRFSLEVDGCCPVVEFL
jgi:hypothetical protein